MSLQKTAALTLTGFLLATTVHAGRPSCGPNARHYRNSHAYFGNGYHGNSFGIGYSSYGRKSGVSISVGVNNGYGYGYGHRKGYGYRSGYVTSYNRRHYNSCPPVVVERPVYVERPVVYQTPVVVSQPVTTTQVVRPIVTQASTTYVNAAPSVDPNSGWDRLARNDSPGALRAFASQANINADAGLPKVGYALAAAATGDDVGAVWAMRRALRSDPSALMYVPRDTQLAPTLAALAERYRTRSQANQHDADAHFMLAAISALRDDAYTATMALDRAKLAGDRDQSCSNLDAIVRESARG